MQNIGPGQLNLDHIDHESGELQKSKCIVVKIIDEETKLWLDSRKRFFDKNYPQQFLKRYNCSPF